MRCHALRMVGMPGAGLPVMNPDGDEFEMLILLYFPVKGGQF